MKKPQSNSRKVEFKAVTLNPLRAPSRSPAQGSTEQDIFSLPQLMLA